MPRKKTSGPRFRLTPDHYVIIAFWAAILGEIFVPLALLPAPSIGSGASWTGALLAAIGLGLEVTVARAMARAGAPTKPYARPVTLVTDGPFRFSRNPFYLGLMLFFGGLLLMLSMDWWVAVMPLYWLALDRFVVPAEEQALAGAFGTDWLAYAARVRRWL